MISPTSKQLILCIDNDVAILHYRRMLLERSGYAVLTASSAREGLRLVTARNCDVVLLYETPGMNGGEVASEIMRVKPGLTIILLSGGEASTHALVFVDAFVLKPEASRRLLPMIVEPCGRD